MAEFNLDVANARIAELEKIKEKVIYNVLTYEGCYDGQIEFLEMCGITEDQIPHKKGKYRVTVEIEIGDIFYGTEPDDIEESVSEMVQEAVETYSRGTTSLYDVNRGDDIDVSDIAVSIYDYTTLS